MVMTTTLAAVNRQAIRDLVRPLDPVVSLYLGLTPPSTTADATEELALRWRAIAGQLATQGAPHSTVETLTRYVGSLPIHAAEVAVFASGDRVLLHRELPGGVAFDQAPFAAPARVAPLLSWLQRHPPYVAIVTDRTGADVTAVASGATVGVTELVVGPDDEVERNAPGGWAQPRYQRRAEDSWRHNAAAVAAAATHALQRVAADLLIVTGDVRAVQLLEARLRDHLHDRVVVHHVPGGRQPDGSAPARRAAIAEQVTAHAAQRTAGILSQFDAERGPHGRVVEGVTVTLAALADGRVDTLVVVDDPVDRRAAWFGPDLLCVDDPTQAAGPGGALRSGRLVDVAVRAALLTDADVRIVDPATATGLAGGIGAACRFAGRAAGQHVVTDDSRISRVLT
jgi:hypothetical protein